MFKLRDKVPYKKEKDFNVKSISRKELKQKLREDFNYKCAYCYDHDAYNGGPNNFHIEHFAPKSKFNEHEFSFNNLLYSCPYCNRAKSNKWISQSADISHDGLKGFVNPCTDDYDKHLSRDSNCRIIPLTELGQYMHKELKLYLIRHEINYMLDRIVHFRELIKTKLESEVLEKKDREDLKNLLNELGSMFTDVFTKFNYN